MSLMLFVLLLPTSSYVAALPFIKVEWGLNNTQGGAVFSAYLAGYVAAALFVIPMTDRFGSKYILVGSAALSVVAHLLFPLVASQATVGAALRAIAGVGFLGVYTPGVRIIAERFAGGGRGTALGLFVTAQYAANSGSLAITGGLMSHMEWREAYLLVSAMAGFSLPLAYFLLRGHRVPPGEGSSGRLDVSVLKSPTVRYIILGYSLHALQLYTIRVWLPLFLIAALVARGIGASEAAATGATAAGLALAVGSIAPIMGGIMSDRLGRVSSASAIFALSGVCGFLIGWTGGLPWAFIIGLSILYGWAASAGSAIYQTSVTEVSSRGQLGSTLAMLASLGVLGGAVGPIVFGGILDLLPESFQWGTGFSALGILAIVAIAGLQRLRSLPESRLLAEGKG